MSSKESSRAFWASKQGLMAIRGHCCSWVARSARLTLARHPYLDAVQERMASGQMLVCCSMSFNGKISSQSEHSVSRLGHN